MVRLIASALAVMLVLIACKTISGEEEQAVSGSETANFKGKVVWSKEDPELPRNVAAHIEIGLTYLDADSLISENIFDSSTIRFDVSDLALGAYELNFHYKEQNIIVEFRLTEPDKTTELIIVFLEFFKNIEYSSSSSVIFSSQDMSSIAFPDSLLSSVTDSLSSSWSDSVSSEEYGISSSSEVVVPRDTMDYSLSDVHEHVLPGIIEFEDFVSPGLSAKYGWPFNESDGIRTDKVRYDNPRNTDIYGMILNYPDLGEKDTTGVEMQACVCHLEYRFESDGGYNDGSRRGCYLSHNMPSDQEVTSQIWQNETGPWNVCIISILAGEKLSYLVNFPKKGTYNVYVSAATGHYQDINGDLWSESSPGFPFTFHLYNLDMGKKHLTFSDNVIYSHSFPEDGAQWTKVRENHFTIDITSKMPDQMILTFESNGHPYSLDYIRFELAEEETSSPQENSAQECRDGKDNDDDSLTDCADLGCAEWSFCKPEENGVDWFENVKEVHQVPGKVEAEYFVNPGTVDKPLFFFFESDSAVNTVGTGGPSDCRTDMQDFFGVDITRSTDTSSSLTPVQYEGKTCASDANIAYLRNGERLSYALEVEKRTKFRVVARVASGHNLADVYSTPPYIFSLYLYRPDNLVLDEKALSYYILDTGNWMTYYNFIPQQWVDSVEYNDNCDKIIAGYEALFSIDSDCWLSQFPEDTLELDSGQWVMEFTSQEGAYNLNYFEFIEVK